MKKFTALFLLVALTTGVFAQVQRLVLLEHFTQASCGPCATYNPAILDLLDNNEGKIVAIKYHTWWPGVDPMYNDNMEDVNERVAYYGVNSVPNSVLNGNYYNGHPASWGQDDIDELYGNSSPMAINLTADFSANFDSINVTMTINPKANISGNLKAHIVVVERNVYFDSPPGSNGETYFPYLMKKMISGPEGTDLDPLTTDNAVTVKGAWKYENIYDMSELAVVAFVQNHSTKEIFQAAYFDDISFVAKHAVDAGIVDITNIADKVCLTEIAPKIKLQSNGTDPITSAKVTYSFNGEEEHSYDWTGNLGFLEYYTITLDEIAYDKLETGNNITVSISEINGSDDGETSNNVFTRTFDAAPVATNKLYLKFKPDENPGETSWEFSVTNGAVLYSGGPYSSSTLVEKTFKVTESGCVDFIVEDTGDDGLLDGGFFKLIDENDLTIVDGQTFRSLHITPIEVHGPPVFTANFPDGSIGVPIDTVIILTFNEVLQQVDDSPIENIADFISFHERAVTGPEVSFSATLNEDTTQITITPDSELSFNGNYFIIIEEGLEGTFNNYLPETLIAFTAESEVSVLDNIKNNGFKMYPNPANENVTIEFVNNPDVNKIEIYSITGQVVYTQNLSNTNELININTVSFENGVYFIKLAGENKDLFEKLIIK